MGKKGKGRGKVRLNVPQGPKRRRGEHAKSGLFQTPNSYKRSVLTAGSGIQVATKTNPSFSAAKTAFPERFPRTIAYIKDFLSSSSGPLLRLIHAVRQDLKPATNGGHIWACDDPTICKRFRTLAAEIGSDRPQKVFQELVRFDPAGQELREQIFKLYTEILDTKAVDKTIADHAHGGMLQKGDGTLCVPDIEPLRALQSATKHFLHKLFARWADCPSASYLRGTGAGTNTNPPLPPVMAMGSGILRDCGVGASSNLGQRTIVEALFSDLSSNTPDLALQLSLRLAAAGKTVVPQHLMLFLNLWSWEKGQLQKTDKFPASGLLKDIARNSKIPRTKIGLLVVEGSRAQQNFGNTIIGSILNQLAFLLLEKIPGNSPTHHAASVYLELFDFFCPYKRPEREDATDKNQKYVVDKDNRDVRNFFFRQLAKGISSTLGLFGVDTNDAAVLKDWLRKLFGAELIEGGANFFGQPLDEAFAMAHAPLSLPLDEAFAMAHAASLRDVSNWKSLEDSTR